MERLITSVLVVLVWNKGCKMSLGFGLMLLKCLYVDANRWKMVRIVVSSGQYFC